MRSLVLLLLLKMLQLLTLAFKSYDLLVVRRQRTLRVELLTVLAIGRLSSDTLDLSIYQLNGALTFCQR